MGDHITPAPRELWETVAEQDPNTLIFQTPSWMDGLCATGRYEDASRLYETNDGQMLILPLVRAKSIHGQLTALASMPDGWGLGGLVSNRPVQPEHVRLVLADLVEEKSLRTIIRPNPLGGQAWMDNQTAGFHQTPRLTHILDLHGGFEHIWKERFSSSTRTKLRKAEKSGLEVQCSTGDQNIRLFYDLYLRWLDRRAAERHIPLALARWLGERREPFYKFYHASQTLQEGFRVWIASLGGVPVAGAILLVHHNHAFFWRGASIKERAAPVRANDLLQRCMIEDACRSGCHFYHMGESGGVPSLMSYKARFGAEVYPYTLTYRERLPITSTLKRLEILFRRVERRVLEAGQG